MRNTTDGNLAALDSYMRDQDMAEREDRALEYFTEVEAEAITVDGPDLVKVLEDHISEFGEVEGHGSLYGPTIQSVLLAMVAPKATQRELLTAAYELRKLMEAGILAEAEERAPAAMDEADSDY